MLIEEYNISWQHSLKTFRKSCFRDRHSSTIKIRKDSAASNSSSSSSSSSSRKKQGVETSQESS